MTQIGWRLNLSYKNYIYLIISGFILMVPEEPNEYYNVHYGRIRSPQINGEAWYWTKGAATPRGYPILLYQPGVCTNFEVTMIYTQ